MTSPAQQVVAAAVAFSRLYFFPQISSIPSTTLTFGRLLFRSWKTRLRSFTISLMKSGSPKLIIWPAA
jgi:hypothetical protein